jgi:ketopantoate reductase
MHDILGKRSLNACYLVDTLVGVPQFYAREVNQNLSLLKRFRKMTADAVLGPLCALYECPIGEIFTKADSQEIGLILVEETWRAIRNDIRRGLSLDDVAAWVQKEVDIAQSATIPIYHAVLVDVMDGRESDVGPVNGWIVERPGV